MLGVSYNFDRPQPPSPPFEWEKDLTITPATRGWLPATTASATAPNLGSFESASTGGGSRSRRRGQERTSFKLGAHKRRSAQMRRQILGKNLITYLDCLCRRVRDTLAGSAAGTLEATLALHFSSFAKVWDGGLAAFRQVINNHPPSGLIEVVDCLVVASALCTSMCNDDSAMYLQFVNDLGRWKAVLDPDEIPLFDTIAFSLWAYTDLPDPATYERNDKENLARFQELIQDLVTLERSHHRNPGRTAPYASRLSTIQKQYTAAEGGTGRTATATAPAMSIPIPAGNMARTRRRLADEVAFTPDSVGDDGTGAGFSIDEFFDVDRFLAESMGSDAPSPERIPDLGLYDILATTALLVASVAFSVILTLMSFLQLGFDSEEVHQVWRQSPGYDRSCNLLSMYFDSIGGYSKSAEATRLLRPFSLDRRIESLSLSVVSAASTTYTGSPASSISHPILAPQARTSSMTNLNSVPNRDPAADGGRDAKRSRCHSCQKTFSSISNRNKHMREGCAQRTEKTGYRCRNESCSRILTTKWYRNAHEQDRCRYRGTTGAGSAAGSFG
ncbi:unnamed protein product [Parascedosporium putredinis]|uniref:C2H2-type domain-containing protein n=1 Tax=Parascedosporium putredinis TaxID=1442378 RepID=A0A9P1M7A3_9PEZI|nr:unnamed protein product [Parascedosporium putredinis]CAI7991254.1 unnamed protein product [Parascedosporium putredinis]